MSYRGEMGERCELDDIVFLLKESRERMAPVLARLEECRKILDDLEGQVRDLDYSLLVKGLEDALRGGRKG